MVTKIRYVGDLPVEEPELDQEAEAARKRLTELVMTEYAETGSLHSQKVREAVDAFEEYAKSHIVEQ